MSPRPIHSLIRKIFERNPHEAVEAKLNMAKAARLPTGKRSSRQRKIHQIIGRKPGKDGKRTVTVRAMKKRIRGAYRIGEE